MMKKSCRLCQLFYKFVPFKDAPDARAGHRGNKLWADRDINREIKREERQGQQMAGGTHFLTFLTFMLAVLLLQDRMRGSDRSSGISALRAWKNKHKNNTLQVQQKANVTDDSFLIEVSQNQEIHKAISPVYSWVCSVKMYLLNCHAKRVVLVQCWSSPSPVLSSCGPSSRPVLV